MEYSLPDILLDAISFSRSEFEKEMNKEYGLNVQQSKYYLQKKLDQGTVVRAGWNQYSANAGKRRYSHRYSPEAKDIVDTIENNYYDVDFRIFELKQLDQFVNHLVANNTVFVSVESEMIDYAFDTLNRTYPGRVMLKPRLEMYYRYLQDNEIVVIRMPSEAPKGFDHPWETRIEKILVDILVDKLIGGIVPESEKERIIEGAYNNYLVDEATMIRYAKRKGAAEKLREAMRKYGRMVHI